MSGAAVERTDAAVTSDGTWLALWCYRPPGDGPHPAVVMSHGFAAVKELGLDPVARALAEAGFVVVAFDHPGFGASGGEPRQEVDPERQLRASRDVLTYAAGLDDVDAGRLGIWGTSFSGGHAVVLAASDDRVGAAVAQVPFLAAPAESIPDELAEILADDEQRRRRGEEPLRIPVTTDDPAGFGALSPDPAAHRWFTAGAADAPTWRNEVTLASLARLFAYRPLSRAADVQAPLLVISEVDDVLCPHDQARALVARVPVEADLVELPGGHFSVYEEHRGLATAAAVGWFERWLGPG